MFVGRALERKQLLALRGGASANIAILYGRRRVGKTFLVKETYKAERILSFEGLEGQSKEKQISNFLFQLRQQCPDAALDYSAKTWSETLKQLIPILEKNSYVLFCLFSRICGSTQELVAFQVDDTRLLSAFLGS